MSDNVEKLTAKVEYLTKALDSKKVVIKYGGFSLSDAFFVSGIILFFLKIFGAGVGGLTYLSIFTIMFFPTVLFLSFFLVMTIIFLVFLLIAYILDLFGI